MDHFCITNESFTQEWSSIIRSVHLRIIAPMNSANLSNDDTFHYTIWKNTFISIIIDLYEKSLSIGKYKFSKILLFVSNFGTYHWQQIVLFFLKSQGQIVHFLEKISQIPIKVTTFFSDTNFFQVKTILQGKKQLYKLTTPTIAQVQFLMTIVLEYAEEILHLVEVLCVWSKSVNIQKR